MRTLRTDTPVAAPPTAALSTLRRRPSAEDVASVCHRLEALWGLELHDRDVKRIGDGIVKRMALLGIRSSSQYLLQLDDAEIEALTNLTTVGESWFFRDPGQMRLLQHLLLPQLIGARRADRRLRIWSAGCSTGQEPWSLAMLLLEVLPNPAGWDIQILGTDIDSDALAVADAGHYSGWALRGLSEASRSRYFVPRGDGWQTGDALRPLVRFRRDNLTALDAAPIADADLVLCRNVLIYLKRDLLARVVSRIGGALRDRGLLIAGHCELIDVASDGFEVERFPESLVYRRQHSPRTAASSRTPARGAVDGARVAVGRARANQDDARRSTRRPNPVQQSHVLQASPHGRRAGPDASLNRSETASTGGTHKSPAKHRLDLPLSPHSIPLNTAATDGDTPEALMQRAESAAEQGDYASARRAADRARQLAPLDYRPCYLLAQLAELEDDSAEAQRWLASVLYLAPDFIPAYLDAAAQCDRLQKPERAARYRRAAHGLLNHLPQDEPLPPPYQHLQATTLRAYLDELLGESEANEMIALDAEDD